LKNSNLLIHKINTYHGLISFHLGMRSIILITSLAGHIYPSESVASNVTFFCPLSVNMINGFCSNDVNGSPSSNVQDHAAPVDPS